MTGPPAGWTPIRVSWRGSDGYVEWCRTDGMRFDDPFFDQSVERCLRHPFRLLFRPQTRLADLPRRAADLPGLTPSGFVFHLSRCGSTLLAQMFAARPDTRVVSEAGPIDTVLRAPVDPAVRVEWLRAMVAALGQPASEAEQYYVVKFDAWSALDLPLVRQAFPEVPWLFLYRDPVEVLVSHARRRGYHMLPGMVPAERLGRPVPELAAMSPDDHGAAVLAAIATAALGSADEAALLVDYAELPHAAVDRAARHFGIPVGAADRATMLAVATRDAKNHVVAYTPDRDTKQACASDAIRAASRRWAEPAYRKLAETRARQS